MKFKFTVEVFMIGRWVDVSKSNTFFIEWAIFNRRLKEGWQARFLING